MNIKNAEILCVGTEILIGDIVNTNAVHISRGLAELGIPQYYQAVVGDNPDRLRTCINDALLRCDLLILSGGLGPTYDDLTKETAAECMGRTLQLDEEALLRMKEHFSSMGREMPQSNVKQAYIPSGSVVFQNFNGTAPGMAIEDAEKGKIIILLPGPPRELIPMFDKQVYPYLLEKSGKMILSHNINIIGMGESAVESEIGDIMRECVNPSIAPYCGEGEVRLRVSAFGKNAEECEALCRSGIEKIKATSVGKYIYGIDTTLEAAAVNALSARGLKISFAESCTGGLVMKRITDVPGSSSVFDGGIVSYSESVKEKFVGVPEKLIEEYGVVSEEVARAMACGIREKLGSDIGVGITGYAGPSGGDEKNPVGTVFFAICDGKKVFARKVFVYGKDRSHIRQIASNGVLESLLNEFLK